MERGERHKYCSCLLLQKSFDLFERAIPERRDVRYQCVWRQEQEQEPRFVLQGMSSDAAAVVEESAEFNFRGRWAARFRVALCEELDMCQICAAANMLVTLSVTITKASVSFHSSAMCARVTVVFPKYFLANLAYRMTTLSQGHDQILNVSLHSETCLPEVAYGNPQGRAKRWRQR